MTQLIEEIALAVKEVKDALPHLKWELLLLKYNRDVYHHLEEYVKVIEAQLELFKGKSRLTVVK